MSFEKELETALKAARTAGEYLLDNQREVTIAEQKDNNKNYATVQDFKSEKIISDVIKSVFPEDFILSEETSSELKTETRFWIVDPVDGTRNYVNGLPYFSVSIALFQDGEVKVGVVYAPGQNNELFHAVKNQGAFLNNHPLEMLLPSQKLDSTIVATGFTYFKGEELKKLLGTYEQVLNNTGDVVRYGSAALDLCQVTIGRIGAYYESGLKPWDLAAGSLILQEQKGVSSDYEGKPLNIFKSKEGEFNVAMLSSKNNNIHSELRSILNP